MKPVFQLTLTQQISSRKLNWQHPFQLPLLLPLLALHQMYHHVVQRTFQSLLLSPLDYISIDVVYLRLGAPSHILEHAASILRSL